VPALRAQQERTHERTEGRAIRGRHPEVPNFIVFQKDSALAQWFRARTEIARGTRKTMIVALAASF
jgi:transposase